MFRTHKVILELRQQDKEDVYRGRARIREQFRGRIREGRICTVSVGGRSVLLEVRGSQSDSKAVIRMGELSREALGLELGEQYLFGLREVWWVGQFRWAWCAQDPAAALSAKLGLLSFALGLLGLGLGLIALFHR